MGPHAQQVKLEQRESAMLGRAWSTGRKSEHAMARLTFLLIVTLCEDLNGEGKENTANFGNWPGQAAAGAQGRVFT